jgi:hypothetical protein
VRDEQIGDGKFPEYSRGDKDKFEDALRLLAKMIAKDILRKHSNNRQNTSPQTNKKRRKTDNA